MIIMKFLEELEEIASRVDEYLFSVLKGDPRVLYDASSHLMRAGGKRLRPFLVVKSYEMFDQGLDKVIPVASAIELTHNFTLVHDDIMDNDLVRHGAPTVHAKYGIPLAIVAGDVLFAKAFETIVAGLRGAGVKERRIIRLVELMANSLVKICEGQVQDLKMASGKHFYSASTYFGMIQRKTAFLFEASCRAGSIVGGAGKRGEMLMAKLGRHLGIAFQLVDDVLGVVGDPKVTGKPVGNDLREGKKTYVISLAIKLASEEDRVKILRALWEKGATKGEIDDALVAITRTGAPKKVRMEASSYAQKAIGILGRFPDSPAKEALSELTNFIVTRKL